MKRVIRFSANNKWNRKVSGSIELEITNHTRDEVRAKVFEWKNKIHDFLRELKFDVTDIKIK